MNDHIDALVRRMADGEALKFKPFWGHSGSGLGPWILSQWYPAPFSADGNTYQTAEHWMMAQKALLFADAASAREIIAANSPGAAKALGRGVKDFDEETWEQARYAIVVTGNVLKFRQNPLLAKWLERIHASSPCGSRPRTLAPSRRVSSPTRGLHLRRP